jgi:hypothetical protein
MDSLPLLVGLQHIELDEGPGILILLPRCGVLACPQANDEVADTSRLTRLHRYVTCLAVALVEQPQHRDSLRHRGSVRVGIGVAAAGDIDGFDSTRLSVLIVKRGRRGGRLILRQRLRLRCVLSPLIPAITAPARQADASQRGDDHRDSAPVHPSGVQAS